MTEINSFHLDFWLILGFAAQFLFFMRFFVQWIVSERKKESTIPIVFWYLSLAGGSGLFIYSLHIRDPVFILGQGLGIFFYVRNLTLIHKKKEQQKMINKKQKMER